MIANHSQRRRFFVPEVVQTSAMDCGPAVLKCLLDGFGIPVHYGRLREACQTDVDGTSIDVLEEVAGQMGLVAEQVMVPVNHLLLAETEALPAILVVRLPNGFTHFILVWRRHGRFVQIMDPGVGRRWVSCKRLLDDVYVHTHRVPARAWHEWALSEDFRRPLARRLRDLGFVDSGQALQGAAAATPGWQSLALLDAATRLLEALVRAGALRCGRESRGALEALFDKAAAETPGQGLAVPKPYWSVLPAPSDTNGEEQLFMRGAVLVRVRGRIQAERSSADSPTDRAGLSPELVAALSEPASRPLQTLFGLLRGQGSLLFLFLAIALLLTAGGTVLEAVLLRGMIDLGRDLGLIEQRLGAITLLVAFAGTLLALEYGMAGALVRLGRNLEIRFRVAFLEKIPRLHDRYFQSRPTSDMAERSHAIHQVRLLPRLAGQFGRASLVLLTTAAALAWVDPASAPLAFLAAGCALALPLALQPFFRELDLRVRTHAGALSRYYLDALLGLAAVRAHVAERALRREHESLLVEWAQASRRLLRWVVVIEGLQILVGFALAGWLVLLHANRLSDSGGALLLAYWALNLPVLGEELTLLARQYPLHRNTILRLLEPLGAPDPDDKVTRWQGDKVAESSQAKVTLSPCHPVTLSSGQATNGVAITLDSVTVRAAGQTILEDLQVHIPAGSHVAVVGVSGAGKSSLVGLLLGWHRAAAGRILIDGELLDSSVLERLRKETAWVDPTIQLWNRTLVGNLLYGAEDSGGHMIADALNHADLYDVLERLPDGLQTTLGEGGGLLSGGEGQRVRLGRALIRSQARLVILDEPFRGLDRAKRRCLLERARHVWRRATLLCITHDVGETRDFERVLVIDSGRIVEDDRPAVLAEDLGSRYRALLDAEEAVRKGIWSNGIWRRLRIQSGRLLSDPRGGGA